MTISLFTLVSLSACGGGGGGTTVAPPPPPPPPPPTGGIGRNGVAVGTVTDFGSIFVNGVEYSTNAADFTINDSTGDESDLSVGDVVTVRGTIDDNGTTGTADTVTFDDLVKGPVDSVNVDGNSLVVMGQTVRVTVDTSYDNTGGIFNPASLEGVLPDQIVEVSGYFNGTGEIVATRIEPKPVGTQFEVHGTVSNLNNTSMKFNLSALVVDFSPPAAIQDFPSGQISQGDFVEAKGMSIDSTTGELTATIVELESRVPGTEDGDRMEIEGYITRFVSATDFDVDGMNVTTNTGTTFTGGDAGDLGLNVKVEVKGDVDANKLLTADEVDIRRPKVIRIVGDADSVHMNSADTLVILGITVTVDDMTRVEDKRSGASGPLDFADINMPAYIEVRGSVDPDATEPSMLAAVLEVDDADTRVILQGFVETVGTSSYTVLGVTIGTGTGTKFFDENDFEISSGDFFTRANANPNSLVKARWTKSSATTITAEEVEFEVEF